MPRALLERIDGETLETENVDGADEEARLAAEDQRRIDCVDDKIEQPRIQRLCERSDARRCRRVRERVCVCE